MKGMDIAYERAGSGPPLVLAHGADDDHRGWAPQLAGLAEEFTVIAWDEPGRGASSPPPAGFTLAGYADCLAALVGTFGPAFVGGISWGGTVVLELFRRRPELVRALVLVDTYAGWKGSLDPGALRERIFDTSAELDRMSNTSATLRAQLALMAAADLRDVFPTIDVPTLLVWGEDDPRSPLSVARQFEAAIPHAELVVIPGAGHLSNLDRPAEFNSAVRRFCGTVTEWTGTSERSR